jgi:hypothetical protein
MIGSQLARAAGLEGLADFLALPMKGIVSADTLDAAGKITGIETLRTGADAIRASMNGLVIAFDAAAVTITEITNGLNVTPAPVVRPQPPPDGGGSN